MPVYDYSYQTYDGPRQSALLRWLAIPKFTYLECFEKRVFLQFFMVAWLQLILRLAYMYLLVNVDFLRAMGIPLNILVPVNALFFKSMIDFQMPFCFIFSLLIGAGLISRDLQHSAFVLYASKPISRWEYCIGKFSVLFFLFMALTWAQTALLFVIQPLISAADSDWWLHFWSKYAWIFPATTAYAVVIGVTLSLLILAASSLTRNARYAGMIFAGALIGAHVTAQILCHSLSMPSLDLLSPLTAILTVGDWIFRLDQPWEPHRVTWSWVVILGLWAMCAGILKWRLDRAARYEK